MATLPTMKRGDTFAFTVQWEGAQLSELKSQVRDSSDKLLSEVVIEAVEGVPDTFSFKVINTMLWPVDTTLFTDIQRTYGDGTIRSSETLSIRIEKDVTQ